MSTIITRNSANSGSVPSSLVQGELAINVTDNRLFFGSGSGNDVKEFGVTASYALSSSYAETASYAPAYLPLTGGTINGDVTVNGTASIAFLNVTYESASVIYSSGSNQFGDALNDTQTLWGTVDVKTGPVLVTGSLNMSGSIYNPSSIHFNITSSGVTQVGQLGWDDGYGTLNLMLKGGNVDVELGQENVVLVFNANGTTLNKGEVVYVSGSQGNRPAVSRAIATSDGYSATTLGFVAEPILAGAEGYVTTFGFVNNINTSGSTGGTPVWLSPTIAGGWTTTKPVAPQHTVLLGYIVRVHPTVGSIFTHISNGWELGELHDVRDTTTTASYGDLIVKSGSIWITGKQLTGSYGLTGSLEATSFTGSLLGTASYATTALSASYAPVTPTFPYTGSAEITGSLIVTGSITQNASTASFGGLVGIGTTTPAYDLEIKNTTGGARTPILSLATSTYSSQIIAGNSTYPYALGANSFNLYHAVAGPIGFYNGGSSPTLRMSILSDGKTIIGNATSATKIFEVNNAANGGGIGLNSTAGANTQISIAHTSTGGNNWAFNSAANGSSQTAGTLSIGSTTNNMLLFSNGNVVLGALNSANAGYKLDVNGTTRLNASSGNDIITDGTNVTINGYAVGASVTRFQSRNAANSLTYKLTIPNGSDTAGNFIGNVIVTGYVAATSYLGVQGSGTGVKIYGSNNNATPGYFQFLSNGGASTGTYLNYTYDGQLSISNTNAALGAKLGVRGSGTTSSTTALLVQNSNASASLVVNDAGNTLIGTATDAGFKLNVSGSGRFTNGLTVTGSVIATSFTGSLLGTASYATQALSASYAPSTPTFPYTGSAIISGSLTVTGSLLITGSATLINEGPTILSGSFKVQGEGNGFTGPFPAIEVDDVNFSRKLYDFNAGSSSIDFGNRVLTTANGAPAISWDGTTGTYDANLYQAQRIDSVTRDNLYGFNSLGGQILDESYFDAAVSSDDLVYLNTDGQWYQVDQTTDTSTKLLGIAKNVFSQTGSVLIEGDVVVSTAGGYPNVSGAGYGLPIYIREGAGTLMSTTVPTTGYVRLLGHCYYTPYAGASEWIMKFRPSHEWYLI